MKFQFPFIRYLVAIVFLPLLCWGQNYTVSTLAGSGSASFTEGLGAAASFNFPVGVATDAANNIYVADVRNYRIRKINPSGLVTTFAGSGTMGFLNGESTVARFSNPSGVAVDAFSNVYVADESNNRIRKITPLGVVSTLAGSGARGSANGTGTAATFNRPYGIAVDAAGNVFVADFGNSLIRKITAEGVVSTFAGSGTEGFANGTGTAATFKNPIGLAIDAAGNVYVADFSNNSIRKITSEGVVTTLAGSGFPGFTNSTGTLASFRSPTSLAVDPEGNVYVTDQQNHRIRRITSAGVVTTLAGSGTQTFADGIGTSASFNGPSGIAIDATGNLYVGDQSNHRIRKIISSCATPATPTITGNSTFCNGGSTVLTSSATTGNLWSNGATTRSITAIEVGNYTVQFLSDGCTSLVSNAIAVTITAIPTTPFITGFNTYCTGGSTLLTSSVTSGNLWSNNQTTRSITVTNPGNYSLRVITNGCTSLASSAVAVTVNAIPDTPIITGINTFCVGGSTLLTSSSATGNLWSNNQTTQSITVTNAGNYSVRVITNGCTSLASSAVVVTANPTLATPTITGNSTFCNGSSTVLTSSATTGNLWSNGATSRSITVTEAGNYTTQFVSGGCTSAVSNTVAVTITALPATPIVTGNNTLCGGNSTRLTSSATTGNLWSNNQTTRSITVTTPGNYSVRVIANGCTSLASSAVEVTANAVPATPNVTGSNTFCVGSSTILTSSATTGNLWNNNQTTQSITVTNAGNYSVRLISNGCTSLASSAVSVTTIARPATPIVTGTNTFCAGNSTILTSSATTGNFWSNGATSRSITVTEAGNYTVRLIANGCTSLASNAFPVTVNAKPATPTISSSSGSQICVGNSTVLLATNANNYLWSNGSTTQTISVNSPGTYTVRVISINGCTSEVSSPMVITTQSCSQLYTGVSTWSPNNSPTTGSDVIVQGNVTLESSITLTNLRINNGGSINITNGNTLTLLGDLSNGGVIGGAGVVRLAGYNNQNFGGGNISNLLVDNGARVVQNEPTLFTGSLTVGDNQILDLNNLITEFKSVHDLTASLAIVPSTSFIVNATQFTQQRWLDRSNTRRTTTNNGNYFLTGAAAYEQTVNLWNSVSPYSSTTFSGSGSGSLYFYNTTNNNWEKPISSSQELLPGKGIQVWFGVNNFFAGNRNHWSVTGTPIVGIFHFPISNQIGFHLVANPYPSTIDWDSPNWIRNNIANAIYIFDWKNQRYNTYIEGIGTNGASRYLATAQGFFVNALDRNPILIGIESIKVSNRVALQRSESTVNGLIRLQVTNGTVTDEMVIANRPAATALYEADQDAQKMMNPTTNIFVSGAVNQSIASMNLNSVNSIPFVIQTNSTGTVTLNTTEMSGLEGYTFNLFNEQTGELLPYTGTETYTFNVTANQPYRLQLRVGSVTGITNFQSTQFEVFPNPATDKVTIRTNGTGALEIVNVVGQVVITQPATETNEINVSKLAKGVYTVKFNGNSQKLVVR